MNNDDFGRELERFAVAVILICLIVLLAMPVALVIKSILQ